MTSTYDSTMFFFHWVLFLFLVPQIIILGPPASGKRTISKMVCTKLRCAHITTENLVEEADVDFKLGIKKYQQQGKVTFHWHQDLFAQNIAQLQNVKQQSYIYWQGDTDRTLGADY